MCRWHHPYGREWRDLKSLLMKLKEESEKVGLKLIIQNTKIMASGPITSWEIDGETVERNSSTLATSCEELTHWERPWCWGKGGVVVGLGEEEKGMTEDEMAGWHHRLYGHEFEWTPWVGDGQGGLACCDSWDRNKLDMTEWLNWTDVWVKNRKWQWLYKS